MRCAGRLHGTAGAHIAKARTRRQLPFRGDGRPNEERIGRTRFSSQAPVGWTAGKKGRREAVCGGWRVGEAEYRMSDASSASL